MTMLQKSWLVLCLVGTAGCAVHRSDVPMNPWADAGATLEPTVVVRETEVYVGYRSDCARRPEEIGRSDACVAVHDRWFGVERFSCEGPCTRAAVSRLGLDRWLRRAQQGYTRLEAPVVVSSGVVPGASVASVVRNLRQVPEVGDVRVGASDDVWWASNR